MATEKEEPGTELIRLPHRTKKIKEKTIIIDDKHSDKLRVKFLSNEQRL
jgi:hypothetical protein